MMMVVLPAQQVRISRKVHRLLARLQLCNQSLFHDSIPALQTMLGKEVPTSGTFGDDKIQKEVECFAIKLGDAMDEVSSNTKNVEAFAVPKVVACHARAFSVQIHEELIENNVAYILGSHIERKHVQVLQFQYCPRNRESHECQCTILLHLEKIMSWQARSNSRRDASNESADSTAVVLVVTNLVL